MNMSSLLNWVNLVLGVWILISPWVLGFSGFAPALWSNIIVGVLIAIFALWALFGSKSVSSMMPPQQ
ncbi:MAG: SPW repeat protein [Patescibacteria group bacterium]